MRNVDKIKSLEKELGRYRKKVADQQRELNRLEKLVQSQAEGADQVNILVDAILAAAAVRYGQAVEDDDGDVLGYRLELEDFQPDKLREAWKVSAQKRGGSYIIGVMPRQEE